MYTVRAPEMQTTSKWWGSQTNFNLHWEEEDSSFIRPEFSLSPGRGKRLQKWCMHPLSLAGIQVGLQVTVLFWTTDRLQEFKTIRRPVALFLHNI